MSDAQPEPLPPPAEQTEGVPAQEDEPLYRLAFLCEEDGNGDGAEALIRQEFGKVANRVELTFQPRYERVLLLEIVGTRKLVDSCQQKIGKLSDGPRLTRVEDELGETLRAEAYPILGRIEQQFRRFINEAMVQVLGFDWWDRIGLGNVQARVNEIAQKNKASVVRHHPIEYTDFEHLLLIVTGHLAHWQEDRPVTAGELLDLLTGSANLDEVKRTLQDRTEKRSLWDSVFAYYFADQEHWTNVKKELLGPVIKLRNAVMHHRPVLCHEVEQLARFEDEILEVLATRKREVALAEREEVQAAAESVVGSVRDRLSKWDDWFAASQAQMNPIDWAIARKEMYPSMIEGVRRAERAAAEAEKVFPGTGHEARMQRLDFVISKLEHRSSPPGVPDDEAE
jgi:hypothetical protein